MRNYEAVFIFRTESDSYTSGLEKVKEEIDKAKAVIIKEDDMGERELAYLIKKESRGHYYFFELDLKPDSITKMESNIKLFNEVLKFMIIRKD